MSVSVNDSEASVGLEIGVDSVALVWKRSVKWGL